MSYASGQTIRDDEYNTFATGAADGTPTPTTNNVNLVWGDQNSANIYSGAGYGQSGELAAVAAGATVTATQWANMLNRISTMASHQDTTITSITNPTVGDTIDAYAALSANIDLIKTNRGNAVASGTPITSGGSAVYSGSWGGTSQNQGLQQLCTFTFASSDAMRYFFNCGGLIKWSATRTGGSATAKNTGWTNLCNASGTIAVKGKGSGGDNVTNTIAGVTYNGTTKIGGSGTPNILSSSTGALDVTNGGGYTAIFRQYDSTANYTANLLTLYIERVSETVLRMAVNFNDAADANTDESVDGTFTSTFQLIPPSTTYLSNTWGTPTMSTSSALFG